MLTALAAAAILSLSPLPKAAKEIGHKHFSHKALAKKEKAVKKVVRDIYLDTFKADLRKKGRPDEAIFLISQIAGESNGNHMAVSYLAPKGGSKNPGRWHCGPVQTQSRSLEACQKIQRDPRWAAAEALRVLRIHDKIGPGSRECNWKKGPSHIDCRRIRAKNNRTS